jgi:hypothetical protein
MNIENIEKVEKVIELQRKANYQIEQFGEADHDLVDQMIELADTLTPEEQDAVLELYYGLNYQF